MFAEGTGSRASPDPQHCPQGIPCGSLTSPCLVNAGAQAAADICGEGIPPSHLLPKILSDLVSTHSQKALQYRAIIFVKTILMSLILFLHSLS